MIFHRTPPAIPTPLETDTTRQIQLGQKLHVEITRIKKASDDKEGKRVVTSRRNIRWQGARNIFYKRGKKYHFIDTQQLMWESRKNWRGKDVGRWKLQFDEHYCEPLGKDGKLYRSPIVSMILRDTGMNDLITIAATILPVQITRTTAIAMIVAGVTIGLIGFGIDPLFHTAPNTVIHWLTRPPIPVGAIPP